MSRLRNALLGASAVALIGTAASAADLSLKAPPAPIMAPVPTYSWTGFYVGGFGGYGFDHNEFATGAFSDGSGSGSLRTDPGGGLFGGTLGYRVQFGRFVIGIQFDEAWSDIKGDNDFVISNGNQSDNLFSAHQSIDNLGFGLLTAAWAVNPDWIIGVAGGGAWGQWKANGCTFCQTDPWTGSASGFSAGWTIQGFTEYALNASGWTFVTRGGVFDLGSKSFSLTNPNDVRIFNADINVRGAFVGAGFNYKFGSGASLGGL